MLSPDNITYLTNPRIHHLKQYALQSTCDTAYGW